MSVIKLCEYTIDIYMNTENIASSSVSEISSNSKLSQFSEIPNLYKLAELHADEDSGMMTVVNYLLRS